MQAVERGAFRQLEHLLTIQAWEKVAELSQKRDAEEADARSWKS